VQRAEERRPDVRKLRDRVARLQAGGGEGVALPPYAPPTVAPPCEPQRSAEDVTSARPPALPLWAGEGQAVACVAEVGAGVLLAPLALCGSAALAEHGARAVAVLAASAAGDAGAHCSLVASAAAAEVPCVVALVAAVGEGGGAAVAAAVDALHSALGGARALLAWPPGMAGEGALVAAGLLMRRSRVSAYEAVTALRRCQLGVTLSSEQVAVLQGLGG